jgi:hypothetical protein
MASNVACIGLGVDDEAGFDRLIDDARRQARPIGSGGGTDVYRFEDPSGARLVLGVDSAGRVVQALPSFAAPAEAWLAHVRRANSAVAIADLVDAEGEQLSQLAVELEQRQLLGDPTSAPVAAALVALGNEVRLFEDVAAFHAAPDSLLVPGGDPDEPRPETLPEGISWPVRVSAGSFTSYGVWGEPAEARATARMAGVVTSAEVRVVALTGQRFVAATVDSICPMTVCYPDRGEPVPVPGAVIAGSVFMVGSIPSLEAPPEQSGVDDGPEPDRSRRRFWRRR